VLGDLVDRKQSQADHAAKEEKECMDKYLSKWETLDPSADREKERAGESQRVKEAALAEAQHYIRVGLECSWPMWSRGRVGVGGAQLEQLGCARTAAGQLCDRACLSVHGPPAPAPPDAMRCAHTTSVNSQSDFIL
jgi:hypothetical protein